MSNKILLTGGYGFLGEWVYQKLLENGYKENDIFRFRSKDYDLTKQDDTQKLFNEFKPDSVIHLAARVGGIGANKENPGKFFYDNMIMGVNVVESSRINNVKEFIQVGTVCSYPKFCTVPFKETDIWNGYPEETNAPYGIAKKALNVMLEGYSKQYNLKSMVFIPCNLYGPGDNFDEKTSHVIPALIKKVINARNNNIDSVDCWGDGSATREFLYVKDCAEILVKSLGKIGQYGICNIGSGFEKETSIKDLVYNICKVVGYEGNINWQTDKPNGQPRRLVDSNKLNDFIDYQEFTPLDQGLRETVDWYVSQ